MIIGHGSLAKLLKDREGVVLFASGVGNSKCEDKREFNREEDLLIMEAIDQLYPMFYFSSIIKQPNAYGFHKWKMEQFVKRSFHNYTIIRLGNLWQCTNPNTFLNYLRAHPEAEVRENEIKYMIDADTLNMIVHSLPLTGKHEISVFTERLTVKECLSR